MYNLLTAQVGSSRCVVSTRSTTPPARRAAGRHQQSTTMTPHQSPAVSPSPKRRHHPGSARAARTTRFIPNEIISEILSRVPVNSARRFRGVSTEWRALISDPNFVAAHESRHAEPLVAVSSFGEGGKLQLLDVDGFTVSRTVIKDGGDGSAGKFSAVARPHDLICITDDHTGARVVDPATGEVHLTIPRVTAKYGIPYDTTDDVILRVNTAMGFGRAVPSGTYKVVRLVRGQSCWVLTLPEDAATRLTSKRSLNDPPTRVATYPGSVAVVKGVLYVLALDGFLLGHMIHCFDLESEQWKTIQGAPKAVGHEVWRRTTKAVRLAELNGVLCMVQQEDRFTNMWLLTDSEKSVWVKAYKIRMTLNSYNYMPLRMAHDGGRLLFQCELYHRRAHAVKSYDPFTRTCTTVMETSDELESKIGLCSLRLGSFIPAKISSK